MSASLKPLIIQGDRSILLDVHAPEATDARFALIPFAELEKSPEHLHTYRLTGLSLWNAASAGFTAEKITEMLKRFSRFDIPPAVLGWVEETPRWQESSCWTGHPNYYLEHQPPRLEDDDCL